MSSAIRTEEGRRLFHGAVDLHRRGRLKAAEESYRAYLAAVGPDTQAAALLGLLLLDQGRTGEAVAELRLAVAQDPDFPLSRSALGNGLMRMGKWQEAASHLEHACRLSTTDADLWRNFGTARKNLDDLPGAIAAFRKSLRLRRGYDPLSTQPPQLADSFTNGVKLQHDLAQIELLLERYPGRSDLEAARQAIADELVSSPDYLADPFRRIQLSADSASRIGRFYNRLIHEPRITVPSAVIARPGEIAELDRTMSVGTVPFAVIDDFLSCEALSALRQLCEESTFWFETKDHGGHVGAYLDEGFDHPLVIAIATAMKSGLPSVMRDLPLKQAWAYKYANEGSGTRMHADQAAFTLNLWITPPPENSAGGGLMMTDVAAPGDWSFERYNADPRAIQAYLDERKATFTHIPYRANRAVFFRSGLFHRTDPFRFGERYVDRRVNVSFMFGGTR